MQPQPPVQWTPQQEALLAFVRMHVAQHTPVVYAGYERWRFGHASSAGPGVTRALAQGDVGAASCAWFWSTRRASQLFEHCYKVRGDDVSVPLTGRGNNEPTQRLWIVDDASYAELDSILTNILPMAYVAKDVTVVITLRVLVGEYALMDKDKFAALARNVPAIYLSAQPDTVDGTQ